MSKKNDNSQMYLPGFPVRAIREEDVPIGLRVLDRVTGKVGVVSDVREGNAECLEVFIKMDGDSKEKKRYQFKDLVVL